MKKRLLNSLLHILLFICIEVAFVFIVLHEFPEVSFFEELWIIHLIYWLLIFIAWYLRDIFKSYKTKFVATYLPLLFHVFWHFYVWHETIYLIDKHNNHSDIWLIVSTIILWIFIFIWEYLLHNKYHCESHHDKVHKHCKD